MLREPLNSCKNIISMPCSVSFSPNSPAFGREPTETLSCRSMGKTARIREGLRGEGRTYVASGHAGDDGGGGGARGGRQHGDGQHSGHGQRAELACRAQQRGRPVVARSSLGWGVGWVR